MHKVCVDLWSIFHEILNPNIPILSGETLAEDLRLKFQSLFKGHLCTLQDCLLKKGINLSAQMSDINFWKLRRDWNRTFGNGRNFYLSLKESSSPNPLRPR